MWLPMISRLEEAGYKVDETLFGHPYDWRMSVHTWRDTSFKILQEDIEKASRMSRLRVVVTALSMGCPYATAFFAWAGKEWCKLYIQAFVPFNGGFTGSVNGMQSVMAGLIGSSLPVQGSCPTCLPREGETQAVGISPLAILLGPALPVGSLLKRIDHGIGNVINTCPSAYWMMPQVDYTQNPPADPVVISFPKGIPNRACSKMGVGAGDNGTASLARTFAGCGASRTADGSSLKRSFLKKEECAECKWVTSLGLREPCGDGFLAAQTASLLSRVPRPELLASALPQTLCCRRHTCAPARGFKASELPEMFASLGDELGEKLARYAKSVPTSGDPGVPVYCVFSTNVKTPEQLTMSASSGELAAITFGNGDKVVHAASLEVCSRWNSTVRTFRINNTVHGSIQKVPSAIDVLLAVATSGDLRKWQPGAAAKPVPPAERVVKPREPS